MGQGTRDVLLHAAVTIVPRANGVPLLGMKDQELCQWAAELQGAKFPYKESHIKRAFDEMAAECIKKMRGAGMIRA